MRIRSGCLSLSSAILLFAAAAQSGAARADVGPRPECPPGTHHAYLMGHRCVKNGYRLERNAEGDVVQVPIPGAPIAPAPVIAPSGADDTTARSAPTPPPAPASSGRAGGCSVAARGGAAPLVAPVAALALLFAVRRRRARSADRR